MQAERIEKIVLTKSHKKNTGGDYWYSRPGSIRYTISEIYEMLRNGTEIEFHNGKEDLELLTALAFAEKGVTSNTKIDFSKQGEVKLLSRIIKAGGFIEYINSLQKETK